MKPDQNILPHNKDFNECFNAIANLTLQPFVGQNFGIGKRGVLVFGHNGYLDPEEYENKICRLSRSDVYQSSRDEFTFGWNLRYTRTWRNFITGCIGQTESYGSKDTNEGKVAAHFVSQIAFTNYITRWIKSNQANDIKIEPWIIQESHLVNTEIIKCLKPTHIICWGKKTYDYVKSNIFKTTIDSTFRDKYSAKKGFESRVLRLHNSEEIKLLKVYHPSMPGFHKYHGSTHKIIQNFLEPL